MSPLRESLQSDRFEAITQRILDDWPIYQWQDTDVLIAVSGGPDSVALFRILWNLKHQFGGKGSLIVAHCNHQTRTDSQTDALFVRDLVGKFGVKFLQFDRQPSSGESGKATLSEESLRDFRLNALLTAARERGIRHVATGHNASDQIETVLFRLFRGTGLPGLTGIPFNRVDNGISIVRPMLRVRRAEILELLNDLGQPWRSDPSNHNSNFTRNFLRNEILPMLASRFDGQFENSVLRLVGQVNEQMLMLDAMTDSIIETATVTVFQRAAVDIRALAGVHDVLIRHALTRIWSSAQFPEQSMSYEKWQQLADLVRGESRLPLQLPGKMTATIEGNQLIIM